MIIAYDVETYKKEKEILRSGQCPKCESDNLHRVSCKEEYEFCIDCGFGSDEI